MEVKKETKRISYACDKCKQRKRKCSGTWPCAFCAEHELVCSYIKENKKRGPVKKYKPAPQKVEQQLTLRGSSGGFGGSRGTTKSSTFFTEDTLCAEFERCRLADLFLNYTSSDPLLSTTREKLVWPTTMPQRLIAVTAMATVLRATTKSTMADQYMVEARTIAGQILEEISTEAATAFLMLSCYFPIHDHKHGLYTAIAHNISKRLPRITITDQRLYHFTLLASTVLDSSMEVAVKQKILSEEIPHIKELGAPSDLIAALMIKVYCRFSKFFDLFVQPQEMLFIKDIVFTAQDAEDLLLDVQLVELVMEQHTHFFGDFTKMCVEMGTKLCKVVVYWRSGDNQKALVEADILWTNIFQKQNWVNIMNDVRSMWVLSLFFYCVGEHAKGADIYNMLVKSGDLTCTYIKDFPPLGPSVTATEIPQRTVRECTYNLNFSPLPTYATETNNLNTTTETNNLYTTTTTTDSAMAALLRVEETYSPPLDDMTNTTPIINTSYGTYTTQTSTFYDDDDVLGLQKLSEEHEYSFLEDLLVLE